MRIDYQGQRQGDSLRFALITNIQEHEVEVLDRHLMRSERSFDTLGDSETYEYYVKVEDKEDFEDFKGHEYKRMKENLKSSVV